MDPNHRDRIAFARLCSGKLTRGMKAKLVRTGKNMSLSSPQFFFAQDRALADEAFAGDVVGIPKGNTHSPYYEQIVQALMEKRGMDKGKASAIAWGALRKWQRGGGHVHSEVRAAATGALAGEKVAQARAHAHASTWDELGTVIDLAAAPRRGWDGGALERAAAAAPPPQQGGTLPPRVPAGSSAGGQFGAAPGSPPPAKPLP